MSECDFENCREPSTVRVTYGLYESFRRGRVVCPYCGFEPPA